MMKLKPQQTRNLRLLRRERLIHKLYYLFFIKKHFHKKIQTKLVMIRANFNSKKMRSY